MNSEKEKNKKPNYILLTKIIIAVVGVICTFLGIWGLFGLTKVHLPQSKTEGRIIGIISEDVPNTQRSNFIYTFEYIADDGETRQFDVKYSRVAYMPEETVTVWYFNSSKEANGYYTDGWLMFGIFMPIGTALILVNIFAIKNPKHKRTETPKLKK